MIVAIIALIAALSGAAYAASGGLTGKQKKEVEKLAKKFAGKEGAAGKDGAAGPAGAAGPKGDKGDKGEKGDKGDKGPKGDKGEPWVPDNELPAGATLTGTWAFGLAPAGGEATRIPISFNIPLHADLGATKVHYINAAGEEVLADESKVANPPECKGSAVAPSAEPGNLCVYTGFETAAAVIINSGFIKKPNSTEDIGALPAGAFIFAIGIAQNSGAGGTWAVTAEL
jgi:hypothetical protein